MTDQPAVPTVTHLLPAGPALSGIMINGITDAGGFLQVRRPPAIIWHARDITIHATGLMEQNGQPCPGLEAFDGYGTWEKTDVKTQIDGEAVLIGGRKNFGHTIFEVLPRVAAADMAGCPGTIVVWPSTPITKFLDLLDIPYITAEPACRFADAAIPSSPVGRIKGTSYIHMEAMWWIRQKFSHLCRAGSRRLYLRRNAPTRRVLNEAEVIAALDAYGFEAVDLETMPLAEQIALVASAEITVCPLGACSPISVFNAGAWIELAPPGIGGTFASLIFAAAFGTLYERVKGASETAGMDSDYTVPIDTLVKTVEAWKGRISQ